MDFENDIPKYKKKSKVKPPEKANHKHDYAEGVLIRRLLKDYKGNDRYSYSKDNRCIICGKLKGELFLENLMLEIKGTKGYKMSDEEILEKYKDLTIIDIVGWVDL